MALELLLLWNLKSRYQVRIRYTGGFWGEMWEDKGRGSKGLAGRALRPQCMLPPGDKWFHWTRSWDDHLSTLESSCLWVKKGSYCAGRVIDPGPQEETDLLLHQRSKKEYVWSTGDQIPWGVSYHVLPSPVIKVSGKPQQPDSNRNANGPGVRYESLGHPPGKEPQPAKGLAEGKGNLEQVVEEYSCKCKLCPCDQIQKWELSLLWIFLPCFIMNMFMYIYMLSTHILSK